MLALFLHSVWAATWQNQQNECAPSEDSDQPGHPPSLIRVFAVRIKKPWVLSYPLSAQRRLRSEDSDQTGHPPSLIWVFGGCTLILLVLSCRGSYHWKVFRPVVRNASASIYCMYCMMLRKGPLIETETLLLWSVRKSIVSLLPSASKECRFGTVCYVKQRYFANGNMTWTFIKLLYPEQSIHRFDSICHG